MNLYMAEVDLLLHALTAGSNPQNNQALPRHEVSFKV
jgi:hypothetical protein